MLRGLDEIDACLNGPMIEHRDNAENDADQKHNHQFSERKTFVIHLSILPFFVKGYDCKSTSDGIGERNWMVYALMVAKRDITFILKWTFMISWNLSID